MYDRLSALNQLGAFALAINDKLDATLSEHFGRARSELETLVSVRHCDSFTVGWLGEVLGLTHSAAVRVVDRLESDGRIRRTPQANRRFVGLVLTQSGVKLADKILKARQEVLEKLFEDVNDKALKKALPLFQGILGQNSGNNLSSYRRCRLCDEVGCGERCPVQQTFGPR